MDLKVLFDSWAKTASNDYTDKQWLLSKWEVVEGVEWPQEKIDSMIKSIVEGLELKSSDVLFDLGCGGGWILKALKPNVQKVIGLDFSQLMLTNATTICPEEVFICGEIGKLPFGDNTCDCALSYFVFLNFMDDDFVSSSILDIMRILKKGGHALIGQLPDKTRSADYDKAKSDYIKYCDDVYRLGKSHRDVCRAPQKLFDKENLKNFLDRQNISYHFRNSFNPFYREQQPEKVDWRFDLILEKT